jgi:thymidylate synthase (FAD)
MTAPPAETTVNAVTLSDGLRLEYVHEPEVELWLQAGSDAHAVAAARASTTKDLKTLLSKAGKQQDWLSQRDESLLESLIELRHAGPFYHGTLAVYVDCPLFVWAQIGTHPELRRSRESGRYRSLRPRFYVPSIERAAMVPENYSPMRPVYHGALLEEYSQMVQSLMSSYAESWRAYSALIGQRVAKEVSRSVLPQAIMSTGIISARPLDWLRALSIRTQTPASARVSHVQAETADVFMRVDAIMRDHWPLTMAAFDKFGRVSP